MKLNTEISDWKQASQSASRSLNLVNDETINQVLLSLADEAVNQADIILDANANDLTSMDISNPM